MGIFRRKELSFAKIKQSKSKIDSNKFTTILCNIKNHKEKFSDIILTTRTDDLENKYLKIDKPLIHLPALDFPNRNTGDHEITITPHNIPLAKMSFKIILEVFANNSKKALLKKEFSLTVNKK